MITLFVKRQGERVLAASEVAFDYKSMPVRGYENRNDWKSYAVVEALVAVLGDDYVAVDSGPYVFPRYDVVRRPHVGDEVSYAFNGDSYPCGKVTRVSAGPTFRRVEAFDDGLGLTNVFHRRRLSGSWVKDGTWSLVPGHVNKRNPEF